jgi:hypothetical protein
VKVGDLVTLSSYCLQSAPMWSWRQKIWFEKKPLVGLVVRVEDNPWKASKKFLSANEKVFYYIKWAQEGPGSRYGRTFHQTDGYFLRNDLKFVKKGDFKK